ncbi:MAG: bifunctional folylpolyglutamate synthase/dihydrofolate synthase [Anaerolineae bacterium]|nr:bifunctional folylpolyglutamate synthase/dihydrofolate synthase [Anaerolineae bacterium]
MSIRYQEALAYLNQFINYEKKIAEVYAPEKMDPSRPHRLLTLLHNPHQQYPTLHIAGTNGKGSVAMMCANSLRLAGLRVGLYTSPHLVDFRERFRILTPDDPDGQISQAEFVMVVTELQAAAAQIPHITWFELVTAIAFIHFARQKVDAAVIEVGLGGRLDATNVITPLVSVITSISLDHTSLLGHTVAEIAGEKGGIIKPGVPVITAPQETDALERLRQIAQEQNAPLTVVGEDWSFSGQGQEVTICDPTGHTMTYHLNLLGAHQYENSTIAAAALHTVQPYFPTLTETAIAQAFASTVWPGRLQTIYPGDNHTPPIVLDCAHNPGAAAILAQALTHTFTYQRLWLILGVTQDKDVTTLLKLLLPLAHQTIFTAAPHPRATPPDDLARLAAQLGYDSQVKPDIMTAIQEVVAAANPTDLLCIAGSIFLVGDLLNRWESLQSTLSLSGK